jgi:hypothetical protein
MGFWIKHIVAAVALLILAFVILVHPEWIGMVTSSNNGTPAATQSSIPRSSAAQKFTSFYEQLRYSLDSAGERSKEFIVDLPDTSADLQQNLTQRTNQVAPLPKDWKTAPSNRKFSEGSKVRDQMMAYAKAEGIDLYWTLPRDYIVKHYFESQEDYLTTLTDVVQAISSDFESPVGVYFCPKERAAVVTDKVNEHLLHNCQQLNAEVDISKPQK